MTVKPSIEGTPSCLRPLGLLMAAFVCWNTAHLQACIKKLRADGVEVEGEDLRFLSPLLRHHIGISGQYIRHGLLGAA